MSLTLECGTPHVDGKAVEVTVRVYGGRVRIFINATEIVGELFLDEARQFLLSDHPPDHPFPCLKQDLGSAKLVQGFRHDFANPQLGYGTIVACSAGWPTRSSRKYDREHVLFRGFRMSPTDFCSLVVHVLAAGNLFGPSDPRLHFAKFFNPQLQGECAGGALVSQ